MKQRATGVQTILCAVALPLVAGACIGQNSPPPGTSAKAEEAAAVDSGPVDDPSVPAVPAVVEVTLEQRFQTLEGFGAAVAWYHDRILGKTPEGLYQLLFPELGLDMLRFRNRYQRSDPGDGKLEQEVEIFRRAAEALGHEPKLLITSWSPPASIKASRKEKCGGNEDCTLVKENGRFAYDRFADWWLESVKHFHSIGIAPDFVSIQNEPDFIPPDWEGCKFEASESAKYPGYDKALAAVHARLQSLPQPPRLIGPETLGIHYQKVQNYMAALDPKLLYAVAHHLYEQGTDGVWDWRDPGPPSYVDEMQAVAQATSLPLFQTEFQTDDDKGIEGGFETAWLIHHALVDESAAAFYYWDLIWDRPGQGLVGMKGKSPRPRDQYYSMKHFALHTDPGYTRVLSGSDANDVMSSAYVAPGDKKLTVVVLNTGKQPRQVRLAISERPDAPKPIAFRTTYRPGRSERWKDVSQELGSGLRMPPRSIATFVFAL